MITTREQWFYDAFAEADLAYIDQPGLHAFNDDDGIWLMIRRPSGEPEPRESAVKLDPLEAEALADWLQRTARTLVILKEAP